MLHVSSQSRIEFKNKVIFFELIRQTCSEPCCCDGNHAHHLFGRLQKHIRDLYMQFLFSCKGNFAMKKSRKFLFFGVNNERIRQLAG